MKRLKANVAMRDGRTFLTPGIAVGGIGGLAITKARRSNGDIIRGYWEITHIQSGKAIGAPISSLREAVEICQALGPLADWTRTGDELLAEPTLREQVGIILNYGVPSQP